MRDALREERTLWVTDQIAQDKFPEDLDAFYLLKNPAVEEKLPEDDGGGTKKGKVGRELTVGTHSTRHSASSSMASAAYLVQSRDKEDIPPLQLLGLP